ncbi:hypothetical protein KKH15_00500 [Patescibacteria group bacterium]|nr:hypothetical protein [Patescibacteria group bacterium]MBU1755160.1 hypothetical protein [Patescibacteria group bacterium]
MSADAHGSSSPIPFLHVIEHALHSGHDGAGVHLMARPIIIGFVVALVLFLFISPEQTMRNFNFALFLAPLWMPFILVRYAFLRWVQANKAANLAKQKYILLELRLPRDTMKTPLAMEAVFSNLHQAPGESTWYKRLFLGAVRPWWSFELVSIGGQVKFYVWTREGFRRLIESAFYAQYPGMEIIETEDYSRLVDPTDHHWSMFGAEFTHPSGRPDAYPIKTYVDFGLDRVAKPEEQIDPLAQVLESCGSIGPGEQMWVQFVIRVSKKEKFGGAKDWKDVGREEIEKIRTESQIQSEYVDKATGEVKKVAGFPSPTEGQKDRIKAIERNISKLAFDVGIRSIYAAPKDNFQGSMITSQLGMFKPFNSETYNSLGPASRLSTRFSDWPWEDPGGHHKHHEEHLAVEMYRRRAFFHDPYEGLWNIMSTEELATLYHIPSGTVTTPTMPRIQSSTSEAPFNLPT